MRRSRPKSGRAGGQDRSRGAAAAAAHHASAGEELLDRARQGRSRRGRRDPGRRAPGAGIILPGKE